MKTLVSQILSVFIVCVLGVGGNPSLAQIDSTTFTVDPSLNTQELLRGYGSVSTIVPYADGRILLAGSFNNSTSPFHSIAMIWGDGNPYTQWYSFPIIAVTDVVVKSDGIIIATNTGFTKLTPNGYPWLYEYGEYWNSDDFLYGGPYPIESVWCLYEQDDGRILMGGAIATDSLQPTLFRSLIRLTPDGELDTSFPAIEIQPNNTHSRIAKIYRTAEGKWIVSGNFYSINGHETAFVARLNSDFSVDTSFVSPLKYVFSVPEPLVMLLDDQERMWVSGHFVVTQENPQDTINMIRILPSGAVDQVFLPREVSQSYPSGSLNVGSHVAQLFGGLKISGTDHYLLYGRFNFFNDTLQPCITVVDDAGTIQSNYFMGEGATAHEIYPDFFKTPAIWTAEELLNGSLLIGGNFSDFMGHKHHNLVKLKRGTIGTSDPNAHSLFTIFPNPSHHWAYIEIDIPNITTAEITIFDSMSRMVYQGLAEGRRTYLSTSQFSSGIYFVQIKSGNLTATKKLLITQNQTSGK